MFRFVVCGAVLASLAACGANAPRLRGAGSAPVGTDATTGQPSVSARGLGPGGINRNYHIGADPNFPESSTSGRR